jgi:hypothetical protein
MVGDEGEGEAGFFGEAGMAYQIVGRVFFTGKGVTNFGHCENSSENGTQMNADGRRFLWVVVRCAHVVSLEKI